MAAQQCDDGAFGPAVGKNCRGGFDFTLLFEQSILSLLPSAIFLAVFPLRIYHLLRQDTKAVPNRAFYLKLIICAGFAALQLAYLVLWTSVRGLRNRASVPEASLRVVDALVICALSAVEYTRSVRPSTIVNVYLLSSIVFDTVQLRTLWLVGNGPGLCSIATASLISKAIILAFEAQNKRSQLLHRYRDLPPEATSGILSRTVFWWLNPFLWRGFRTVLSLSDMSNTDPDLSCEKLEGEFTSQWNRSRYHEKNRLLIATLWSLRGPLLAAAVPRLFQTGFTLAQPFLISRIIEFVAHPNAGNKDVGYGLVGATALIYSGLAVSVALYKHKTYRMMNMARGGLISLVYSKTLRVNASSLKDATAMTLMSTDVDSIVTGWTNFHELWASPIDAGLAIYLLERRLGIACVAPVAIALLSTLGSAQIAKMIQKRQERWLEAVQKRVGVTSSFLTNIKGLKMGSLLAQQGDHVQALRLIEVKKAKAYLRIDALMNVCANAPSLLSPVATLLLFAFVPAGTSSGLLTSSTAYYALTIVSLMSSPLGLALNALPIFAASLACFRRIQDYLNLEERQDYRLFLPSTSNPSEPLTSTNMSDRRPPFNQDDIEMRQSSSVIHGFSEGAPIFAIDEGCFGYDDEATAVLRNINVQIFPGTLTIVSGPVGSGKSTFLRTLLGEVRCFKGFVRLASSSISYCGQEPWLQNLSMRDNILCGLDFDEQLYSDVISAVSLVQDIAAMPQGDKTMLGSKGTKLSGGQAQRVALARAVYSRRALLLLDDCLSGLDTQTESSVFKGLLSTSGLLKRLGCTVVFVTHATRYVPEANFVIIFDQNGNVERQGMVESFGITDRSPGIVPITDDQDTVKMASAGPGQVTANDQSAASGSIVASDSTRQTGSTAIYGYYLRNIGLSNFAVYLLLNGSFVFCTRFAQIWIGHWVDAVQNSSGRHTNAIYGASYAGFQLAAMALFGSILLYMFQVMVPRSAQRLHWDLLQRTMHADYSFHSTTDPGITLNRFSQDMTLVDLDLPSFAIPYIMDCFNCLGQAIVIALGVKYIAALLAGVIITAYVLQKFYLRTSRQVRMLDLEAKSPLFSHMLETYSGLESIRAFGWEHRFQNHNASLLDTSQRPFYTLFCIQRWLTLVLGLIVAAIAISLVAFGTQVQNLTNSNAIGVALVNVVTFAQTLTSLITFYTSLETALGAITRIKDFTTQVKTEDDPNQILLQAVPEWSNPEKIEMKDVTVSYSINSNPVLKDISLVMKPGMKVGICGRSGSGKSSLVMALLRLAPVIEGSISVNDHNLSIFTSDAVRSLYNVVPQTPVLFPGSIRANLDPFATHTETDLITILRQLGLWEKISPRGGLHADMESTPLSQGQKQLFCIGRSLVINAKRQILILDESTSSMDAQTELLAMSFVEREFSNHTIIAVAHRLDTIFGFDRIAVLDAGTLVEYDTPENLLNKGNGSFKALWAHSQKHQSRELLKSGIPGTDTAISNQAI